MSVRATIGLTLDVVETIATDAAGYISSSKNSVTVNGGDVSSALTATTTPSVDSHGFGSVALSAGSATLDLTSLTGVNGVSVSLSAKKPRAILFENPSANANAITIAKGASNGYDGFGSAFSLTLQPGQKAMVYFASAGSTIDSAHKTLDLSGTGSQTLKYQVVGGT